MKGNGDGPTSGPMAAAVIVLELMNAQSRVSGVGFENPKGSPRQLLNVRRQPGELLPELFGPDVANGQSSISSVSPRR